MNKKILIVAASVLTLLSFFGKCNAGTDTYNSAIATGTRTIAAGEALFTLHCSGCHNFRQDGIGPQLGGLTDQVSADWIRRFIANPQQAISAGDQRARRLFDKYKVVMPSFASLNDAELNSIVAFLHTQKLPAPQAEPGKNGKEVTDPVPERIQFSGLVVDLKLVAQIPPSSDNGKLPLTRITKLDYAPNTDSPFVLDLRGKLYKLRNNMPTVYMDLALLRPAFRHDPGLATGFGSFAFHPDFAKNGLLYTVHTEAAGSAKADFAYVDSIKVTLQAVVTEWKTKTPAAATFSGTGRELFRVNMVSAIHGVQEIAFNPNSRRGSEDYGMLYIEIGDGGSVENGYPSLPHSLERVWGTVLRIDPLGLNSANGQYGIPSHNPFVQNDKALGEIYAFGFRNPHRITWSRADQMLVSNVGQTNIESINLVMPGNDYGWPIREGNFVLDAYGDLNKLYPFPENDSVNKITYPVAEYDHDEGKAISGGYEYRGAAIPKLRGKFMFGDIPTGRLFYIDMKDVKQGRQATIKEWKMTINGTQASFSQLFGSERVDLHFGRDKQGELYILTKTDGKIYKLFSAAMKATMKPSSSRSPRQVP